MTRFVEDDGGRAVAGYKGKTTDCVCRAIAIAVQRPYQEVYDLIKFYAQQERPRRGGEARSSPRRGVRQVTERKIMAMYGWVWVPTMGIGTGCRVHLDGNELPGGRLVVAVSRHLTAMVDGVVHDLYDPAREGKRCVYGYWRPPCEAPPEC